MLFHSAKMLTILGLLAVFLIPLPSLTEGIIFQKARDFSVGLPAQ